MFSKEGHNSSCSLGHLHPCLFGGLIICIHIHLTLEQHRLELRGSTYVWIFFSNKSQDVELWIWRVNGKVFNCGENRESLPVTPRCSSVNCSPSFVLPIGIRLMSFATTRVLANMNWCGMCVNNRIIPQGVPEPVIKISGSKAGPTCLVSGQQPLATPLWHRTCC